MSDKEKFYDEVIAPALLKLADQCKEAGLSFVAVAEYAPSETARTQTMQPDAGLEITMISHCAKMGVNIDGYIMGIARYTKEKGIDTSSSMVMQRFAAP